MGVAPASFTLLALVLTHRRALVSSLWKSVNMGDLAEAKRVVEGLVGEIQAKVDGVKNGSVTDCGGTAGPKSKLKTRRELKGHAQKIFALQWSKTKPFLVSAAQDGRLIYWDAAAALKETVVVLRSFWVMAVALSPTDKLSASGGLDNIVSIFNLQAGGDDCKDGVVMKPEKELTGHGAFISALAFTSEKDLLSCSGDFTIRHWDVQAKSLTRTYEGHDADVSCVDVRGDKIITGSGDHTLKLWSVNDQNPVHTLRGHSKDLNAVKWVNDNVLVSGGADHNIMLWDVRASQAILSINIDPGEGECTAVESSESGRYIFGSSSAGRNLLVYDSLVGQRIGGLQGHKSRVSAMGRSFDNKAIATASWDLSIRIWA